MTSGLIAELTADQRDLLRFVVWLLLRIRIIVSGVGQASGVGKASGMSR